MNTNSKINVLSPQTVDYPNYVINVDADGYVQAEVTNKEKYTKEELDSVRWVAQMITKSKPNFTRKHLSNTKGAKIKVRYPLIFAGAGYGWLEPVFGENQPTNELPNGYFIKAEADKAIQKIEWREYSEKNDGGIISGEKHFGEAVQLHIYTRGLYANKLRVQLKDNDKVSFDDELTLDDKTDTSDELSKYFTRLIRVFKHADDPTKQVQKVIVNIQLERRWEALAGDNISIKPIFTTSVKGVAKPESYPELKVTKAPAGDLVKSPLSKVGNQPVIIGDRVTDVAEFHPCRYEKISVLSNKKISALDTFDTRDIVIYDFSDKTNTIYLDPIEVVAGFKENLAEIEIILEGLDTNDCFQNPKNKHEGKSIDITHLQNTEAWDGSGAIDNASVSVSAGGVNGNFQLSGAKHVFGYRSHTNSSLKFQISYPYEVNSVFDLFKYFIPTVAKKHKLNIPIKSCHKNDFPIIFHVYPDIKWTLKIAFNFDVYKIPKIKTTLIKDEEYITIYIPLPDAVLGYVKPSPYFEQKVVFGKKMTVANINFALTAQLDQEDDDHYSTELSLTGAIKTKIDEQLKNLGVIGEMIQKLFDGETVEGNEIKEQNSKKLGKKDKKKLKKKLGDFTDDTIEEYIKGDISKKRLKKDTKKIRKKLEKKGVIVKKRDIVDVKIHWPSVGFSFSWSLSEGKTETARRKGIIHKTGYKLEASLFADPIIGMEAKLDFIALVAKAHPIATAVVLIIDAIAALIGAEIDIYFQAEGDLFMEINGFLDTLTGENTFNEQSLAQTNEKVGKIGGRLKFILGGTISAGKSFVMFNYTVSVDGEASLRAEAEAIMAFSLHANEKGFYLQPVFTFEGLEIIAQASVKVSVEDDLDKSDEEDEENGEGLNTEGSYQVIDRTITKLDPIELYN